MEHRDYPGLDRPVSLVGLGAAQVGADAVTEEDAERLLNTALDLGVNLIDTARGYGLSEERVGRHIAHRRAEYLLSTKVGYGVEGHEDWTGPCVTAGVERALRVLKTDVLDVVHLHSCPRDVLDRGDVTDALLACAERGLVRVAAYSGENDALDAALDSERFGGWMASLNVCDQRIIDDQAPRMGGAGFLAKRPLANAPWIYAERPVGRYAEEYWVRWKAMGLDLGEEPDGTALRFAAFQPGVTCVVVGTKSPERLTRNVELVGRGPLEPERVAGIRRAFAAHDDGWDGRV